jgi:hypothetical protein
MTLGIHWLRSQPGRGRSLAYTLYFDRAALDGDTLTLSLSGLSDKFQVRVGETLTPPNGAVITLVGGQTETRFALVQVGDVSANATTRLSASHTEAVPVAGGAGGAVQSNAWAVNLQDAGAVGQTQRGDRRAEVIGTEIDLGTPPSNARFGIYKWEATTWGADRTLIGAYGLWQGASNSMKYREAA